MGEMFLCIAQPHLPLPPHSQPPPFKPFKGGMGGMGGMFPCIAQNGIHGNTAKIEGEMEAMEAMIPSFTQMKAPRCPF